MDAVGTGLEVIKVLDVISQGNLLVPLLVVVIGPYFMLFLYFWFSNKNQERRFNQVAVMYKKNVRLVNDYNEICERVIRATDDQVGYMMSNTAAMTSLTEKISTNQFCPMARVRAKTEGE